MAESQHTCADDIDTTEIYGGFDMLENDVFFDENSSKGSPLAESQHTCADDIDTTEIYGGFDMLENDVFFDENSSEGSLLAEKGNKFNLFLR